MEKRTDDVTSEQKDSRSGTRRKKLAVFVSGGGSNFRSIHEACIRDSVNGDVAVLVTNKRGMLLCFVTVTANCFIPFCVPCIFCCVCCIEF